MATERRALVEFLTMAALVGFIIIALVSMAIAGVADDNAVVSALVDALKFLGGAVVALAYAARGLVQRNRDDGDGGPK